MGAVNVVLAHRRWGHLRGDEWRALEWMALTAWDEGNQQGSQPARTYWAGYRHLAYGMGLCDEPSTVDPDKRRPATEEAVELARRQKVSAVYTRSIKERVRRAVADLAAKDAITVVEQGKGRTSPRIQLHLELAVVIPLARPQRHTI